MRLRGFERFLELGQLVELVEWGIGGWNGGLEGGMGGWRVEWGVGGWNGGLEGGMGGWRVDCEKG